MIFKVRNYQGVSALFWVAFFGILSIPTALQSHIPKDNPSQSHPIAKEQLEPGVLVLSNSQVSENLEDTGKIPPNRTRESNILMATDSVKPTVGYRYDWELFDSLAHWIFSKEPYNYSGLMSEEAFFRMTRLSDSLSPEKVVHGQFQQYRWRVFKGIQKAKKRAKKNLLKEGKIQMDWNNRLVYKNEGIYKIKRIEVPISYKKERYILRFETILWEGRIYHVGKVSLLTDN